MCGRFTQTASPAVIAQQFGVASPPLFTARYNIAPSQPVAAIRIEPGTTTRQLVLLRWGLIPSWAKDPKIGQQCINAKAESVTEKPSFRAAFKTRRCLVIATGFYEWQVQGLRKQPMWIGMKSHRPFAFAGLWEHWHPPEGADIESCTILTTEPNELLRPIHNRMPVILAPSAYDQWLDPTVHQADSLKALLRPYPTEELTVYPVSTLVNNPRHDAPDCLESVSV
ncbi:SOS response-associated peptidase [Nitrospira defluvii]|uniref:Abasic site processing protein n=1 Tax=Nitrospira defluvii TaxID=330214 RepID=A0ABM8RYF8_9BACT|nr:SOS response-associated peptidase [Nitrospira defluvii]CAE6778408.1 Abasic site processing protein YoqW [Nitrospira defluvii]